MEKHTGINTALGIAFLFTIITGIFSLPNKLSTLIVTNNRSNTAIDRFINF